MRIPLRGVSGVSDHACTSQSIVDCSRSWSSFVCLTGCLLCRLVAVFLISEGAALALRKPCCRVFRCARLQCARGRRHASGAVARHFFSNVATAVALAPGVGPQTLTLTTQSPLASLASRTGVHSPAPGCILLRLCFRGASKVLSA